MVLAIPTLSGVEMWLRDGAGKGLRVFEEHSKWSPITSTQALLSCVV